MPAGHPPLQALFSYSHILPNTPLPHLLLLFLYAPIGIFLICLRFLLLIPLLFVILITPSTFTFPPTAMQFLLPLFGFVVKVKNFNPEYGQANIVACNHSGPFDVFPFMKLFNFDVLIDKGFFETSFLARQFTKIVGAIPIARGPDSLVKENDRRIVLRHMESARRPLLFFPEGWDTNCTTGILLYQKFLFSLGKPIVPVALQAHVPFLPVSTSMLGTSVFREVMWLFFFPCIVFELRFLSPQTIQKNESEIEFAKRVQQLTAATIGVAATDYSYKDALQLRRSLVNRPHTKKD